MINFYSQEDAFDADERESWMLGNFGFAGHKCASSSILNDEMGFSCSAGNIYRLNEVFIDPNPLGDDDTNKCHATKETAKCNEALNGLRFRISFYDECMHNKECSLGDFASSYINSEKGPEECRNLHSVVHVSYTCRHDGEPLAAKRVNALWVVCIYLFICTTFLVTLFYIGRSAKLQAQKWEISTVTIQDYTVELLIREKTWQNFTQGLNLSED